MNTEQVGVVEHFGTDYAQACELRGIPTEEPVNFSVYGG